MNNINPIHYDIDFSTFNGLTFKSILISDFRNELTFSTVCDRKFIMKHDQSCCESVYLEDIIGDLQDLILHEILFAEAVTSNKSVSGKENLEDKSFTWTSYKLQP